MNLINGKGFDDNIFSKYVCKEKYQRKGVMWPLKGSFVPKKMTSHTINKKKQMFLFLMYQFDFLKSRSKK
jgi:hypothetical protein